MMRLKMKVWTDRDTGKRYLMPAGFAHPRKLDRIMAYAMTDEETKMVELTDLEWNSLPFFYFKEDGEAKERSTRAPDRLRL